MYLNLYVHSILVRHRAELCGDSDILKYNLHICSENNFPTAAGLASSAAGYACLVSALAALYNVPGDISSIARRGSGSACRSVFGGWVCTNMLKYYMEFETSCFFDIFISRHY